MTQDDKTKFLRAIGTAAAVFGKETTETMLSAYWAVLSEFDISAVEAAFFRHMKASKFFPTPAEIITLIPAAIAANHIGADEAWAIALASFDESATVVWTQQIAEAKAIVQDIFDTGDEVGARMAFRDAYNRIVANAPPPAWSVCQGWDAQRRAEAVTKAVQFGRLPAGSERRYLPDQAPTVTVVALIESASEKAPKQIDVDMAKRGIAMLRMAIGEDDDGIARRESERKKRELQRNKLLAAVAVKLGELH